ncbi:MAG: hypothetical protein SGARI_003485, partial [Bacillariaceae sp.]
MSEAVNNTQAAAVAVPPAAAAAAAAAASSEDELRKQLRSALQSLSRREPLEPTYKMLLQRTTLTFQSAAIPKNKFYKKIGSRLRERVEVYMQEMQGKDPFDRISQRQPFVAESMRASFTLRDFKDHEQKPLLEATLAATAMHPERKRSLDGMALGLQMRKQDKKARTASPLPPLSTSAAAAAASQAQMAANLEQQQQQQREQARQWEEDRVRRQEEEQRRNAEDAAERKRKLAESGTQSALHKIIEPVFKKLWGMEWGPIGNPFQVVIDRKTAPNIAPDYFQVVSVPMNLVYIQEKVNKLQYTTLPQFFGDVDTMINNALLYNKGDQNPYRAAALDLKRKHDKI